MRSIPFYLSCFFIVFFCPTGSVHAEGIIYQLGDGNNYAAAIISEDFQYFASQGDQENGNWCWAACIQMILHYQGLNVGDPYSFQCALVKKAFGWSHCRDQPASCATTAFAADGWTINGKTAKATVDNSPSLDELVDQLAYKDPVIVGLSMPGQNVGHAYVLTAVFFRYGNNNEKIPYKVVLRDPWPKNPSRQEFEWNDFASRINCITYVNLD